MAAYVFFLLSIMQSKKKKGRCYGLRKDNVVLTSHLYRFLGEKSFPFRLTSVPTTLNISRGHILERKNRRCAESDHHSVTANFILLCLEMRLLNELEVKFSPNVIRPAFSLQKYLKSSPTFSPFFSPFFRSFFSVPILISWPFVKRYFTPGVRYLAHRCLKWSETFVFYVCYI